MEKEYKINLRSAAVDFFDSGWACVDLRSARG